ncbi:FG-GAP-like repeat-containing protein [Pelagibaculum spongiae]|uniref:DUF11 domain-containing protein n=1 Tax=Pelagibaculum spongiae TaxID=2080658 RepID=A0A2V1GNB8_9GAMM|nr:FG-GAP-like repeat-containing protein [Pelagibaculum spongiae]PVZ63538.1 hypothetical protein DC094_20865 [Pelagibaculum spongiae]
MQKKYLSSLSLAIILGAFSSSSQSLQFEYDIRDNNLGFNEANVNVPAVGGNLGTNWAEQRKNVVKRAAAMLGAHIKGDVPVKVRMLFNHVDMPCSGDNPLYSLGRPLGYASGSGNYLFPHPTAYQPAPLYNNILGSSSLNIDSNHMEIVFNRLDHSNCPSDISWYYGYDGNPGNNKEDMLTHALQAMVQGLGIATPYNSNNGSLAAGIEQPSFFDYLLVDRISGNTWASLTNASRASITTSSQESSTDLLFVGPSTRAHSASGASWALNSSPFSDDHGRIRMIGAQGGAGLGNYDDIDDFSEPGVYETQAFGRYGVLLHPSASPSNLVSRKNGQVSHNLDLALSMLKDIGWQLYEADLELSSSVADVNPALNENFSVTYTVHNRGPDATSNVTVDLAIPDALINIQGTGNGTFSSNVWSIGDLAVGATATLVISGSSNQAQRSQLVANIASSSRFDPDSVPGMDGSWEDDYLADDIFYGNAVPSIVLSTETASGGSLIVNGQPKSFSLNIKQANPDYSGTIDAQFSISATGPATLVVTSENSGCSSVSVAQRSATNCTVTVSHDSPVSLSLQINPVSAGRVQIFAETFGLSQYLGGDSSINHIFDAVAARTTASQSFASANAQGLSLIELNADNYPEILFANSSGALKKINNTAGVLSLESGDVASNVSQFSVGDLDGDQLADVITYGNNGFNHLIAAVDGNFSVGSSVSAVIAASVKQVHLTDLNNDNRDDLVLATGAGQPTDVYLQNSGSFAEANRTRLSSTEISDVVIADFNGSDSPDLIFARASGGVEFWKRFPVASGISLVPDGIDLRLNNATQAKSADLDGDNDQDLVVFYASSFSDNFAGHTRVYLNNGRGRFTRSAVFSNNKLSDIAIADADGDSDMDIALLGVDGTLLVYLQAADNNWSLAPLAAATNGGNQLLAVDINNDQRSDLVVTSNTGVEIFTNLAQQIPPITPPVEPPQVGTKPVTISGSGGFNLYYLIFGLMFLGLTSAFFKSRKS